MMRKGAERMTNIIDVNIDETCKHLLPAPLLLMPNKPGHIVSYPVLLIIL